MRVSVLIYLSIFCLNLNAVSVPENASKAFWARQVSSPLDAKALQAAFTQLKRHSWLDSANLSEPEVLVALSFAETGRNLLEKFLPLYQQKKVIFRSVHSPESRALGLDPETSAGGYADGALYMDEKSSVVEYLTTFAHEATHAVEWLSTEEGVREADWLKQKKVSAEELARAHALLIRSEHRAFRFQDRFQVEMGKQDPDFEKALVFLVQEQRAFPFPMQQSFFSAMMVSGYGVPQEAVDSYFLKHAYGAF